VSFDKSLFKDVLGIQGPLKLPKIMTVRFGQEPERADANAKLEQGTVSFGKRGAQEKLLSSPAPTEIAKTFKVLAGVPVVSA